MTIQSFDPIQYKEDLRQEWGNAASGWKRWWQRIEPPLQPISECMMELADIQPGQLVLDVATGIGEPAVTVARRVGPSGHVIATDFASRMLDIGRARATELGLDNITFREMDGEALTLPAHTFDAIFCRFGLMYLPDLQQALARMCDLLSAAGRMVAAVWSVPQKVPFISVPMSVALRELDVPPPPPDRPGAFRLADVHVLEDAFRQAGFTQIHMESMTLTFDWSSPDDFVSFHQEILTQLNTLLAKYPVERQIKVWRAIARAVEAYMMPDGILRMENDVILVVGRPGSKPVL